MEDLEDEFPFGIPYFQGRTVKLREGMLTLLKKQMPYTGVKYFHYIWAWNVKKKLSHPQETMTN